MTARWHDKSRAGHAADAAPGLGVLDANASLPALTTADGISQLVLVPPDRRLEVLKQQPDRVYLTDFRVNDSLTANEWTLLTTYLSDNYTMAPQRVWWPPADAGVFVQGDIGLDADPTDAHGMTGADGTTRDHMMRVKIGYDEHGVFIHGDHHRRYVAVDTRDVGAGAPPPPAMPGTENTAAEAALAEQLRQTLMQQTFKVADKNGDGVVSKSELRLLLRRVAPSMKNEAADRMFNQIDRDHNGSISSGEFANWMQSEAGADLRDAMGTVVNHRHFVQAAFRLWDKNGDGTISKSELFDALKHLCPKMPDETLRSLFTKLDVDHSGNVDYTEFINFVWGGESTVAAGGTVPSGAAPAH